MRQSIRLALVSACVFGTTFGVGVVAADGALTLKQGDHVAIIGGGVADRMQHDGTLEAMLSKANPTADLVFRNLGFMGDEVETRMRSEDFGSPEEWLKRVKADVVFAFFGFNESFAGKDGLDAFKGKLRGVIQGTTSNDYSGKGKARMVLFSPTAAEKGIDPDWQDVSAINANLALYSAAMAEVAKEMNVPFVDLFTISKDAYAKAKAPLTVNGLHLSEAGYEAIAPDLFKALAGTTAPAINDDLKKIRAVVQERNAWFFSRYRTVDGYNVYGGRSNLTFDGLTNKKVMQEEMAVRDVITANRDRVVWAAAQGKTVVVSDDNLPPITPVKTNKPDAAPYLDAEAAIGKMTMPQGVKVNVFATEEKFPELVNPVQMAWDAKGRLWVAAWQTYPGRMPSDKKGDSILIFEDSDQDGKADKCITFMDQLNCPTGFQFHKDGILLMQAPDLWYVTIDPKTGLAGHKSRVVGGLDSADSHHQTNAMCYSPGGATFLSDGVFHRTQVETHQGPVRNYDGAIYRYEPRTHRFERYIAYGFANPHGRIFDRWGNDFVTDATGNNNYWGPAISVRIDGPGAKLPGVKNFWPNPSRPCPATGILSSSAWPKEYDGNFLNLNVIGMQGIFRATIEEDGSGIKGVSTKENLLSSSDPNFRPIAISVGPDGAVYFADWSNAIIGHMQHHLRDPVRDHQHGRLYRVTYEGKTIPRPVIAGQPIDKLVELLKAHEDGTRELAKIELGRHDTAKVMAAVDRWVAALDPKDPEHQHHLSEALWTKQWHNVVDPVLLKKQLRSPDHRARAAATHVLCYQRDRVADVLALLKVQVTDEHPRVRVEAVRALSFFEQWEAADIALLAEGLPKDYYLDYVLKATMRQLERWWKPAIAEGKPIAKDNPAGLNYILASVPTPALAKLPPSDGVWQAMFARSDAPLAMRQEALTALAKKRSTTTLATLLDLMQPLLKDGGKALDDACSLLVQQPAADLVKGRDTLAWLTKNGQPTRARQAGIAALMIADGKIDAQWNAAGNDPAALSDRLGAVVMIPDAALRATAAAKIMPLLGAWPAELASVLGTSKGASARYLRIQLPGQGTLTLAEVEVISGGVNIAGRGKAKQSSTDHGGEAQRAIDGNTDGGYGANTSTHSRENEDKPWWEVDLGSAQSIEAVKVWNRTDGDLGNRLNQFQVVMYDEGRKEIARSEGNAAPAPSAIVALAQDAAGALRRAAINAALAAGDAATVAGALQDLLAKGEQVTAASDGLRKLGTGAWVASKAGPAVAGIAAWARALPTEGRTAPEVKRVLEIGDQLAGLLTGDEAAKAKAELSSLSVRVIVVKTVREQMRYDLNKLVVEAGKPFAIELVNEDMMPHNLVVVTPGSRQEIATLAMTMPIDKADKQGRIFVPENSKVLAATKMINPGKRELLMVPAIDQEGTYEYVCTFPGHFTIMWGTLVVTKDPELLKSAK